MKKRLYIAYGSNLDRRQMQWRCPGARVVAKSWLHDYRLAFQGNPYGAHANVIPAKGYDVPVIIWEIDRQHERALDHYEGVAGGYYTKEMLPVEVDGTMQEALVYIMGPRYSREIGIPTDSYLGGIAYGYRDFNLDIRILNQAAQEAYATA